jgi:hypothetical protein
MQAEQLNAIPTLPTNGSPRLPSFDLVGWHVRLSNLTDFCTGTETRGGANRGNQGVYQPMIEPLNY